MRPNHSHREFIIIESQKTKHCVESNQKMENTPCVYHHDHHHKNKITVVNKHCSLCSLNNNAPNASIKRCKNKINPCYESKKNTLTLRIHITSQQKIGKKIFQANGLKKQVDTAILISIKIHLNTKLIKRYQEGQKYHTLQRKNPQ